MLYGPVPASTEPTAAACRALSGSPMSGVVITMNNLTSPSFVVADTQMSAANPSVLWWLTVGCTVLWVTVFLHEAGHFNLAMLLYSPADLVASAPPPLKQLAVVGAGPATTLAILGWAVWRAARATVPGSKSPQWHLPLAVVLGAAAASRILIMAPAALRGPGNFDEATVAGIIGLPVQVVWSLEAVPALLAVGWLVRKMPHPGRRRSLVAICTGIVLGWVSMAVIGPMLLLPI